MLNPKKMEKQSSFTLETINVIKEVAKSNIQSIEESSVSSSRSDSEDEVIVKCGSIKDRVTLFESKSNPILDVDVGKRTVDRVSKPVHISHKFLQAEAPRKSITAQ